MGWRTVVVNTHSKLSYKNNHLIFKDASRTELIHLSEVDILLLETTDIVLSTMLIKRLVDENILVIFCDDKRLPTAYLMPYYGRHDSSLQLSRQIAWNEDVKAEIWTTIIAQKILNQAFYLGSCGFLEKSQSVIDLYHGLDLFDPSNREGHAARIYFNTLFGNDFSREQDSDINAALDYGYTLILSMFAREIVLSGCMTQFGLKHTNQFNQLIELSMKIETVLLSKSNENCSLFFQIPSTTMAKICTCPISSAIILRKSSKLSINRRKEFLSLGYELSIYAYDFNV